MKNNNTNSSPSNPMSRREFIFSAGAMGAVASLGSKIPTSQLVSFQPHAGYDRDAFLKASTIGELHGDLLILPANTPLPEIVSPPLHGFPIFCSAGAGRGGPEPEVVAINIPIAELSKLTDLTTIPSPHI